MDYRLAILAGLIWVAAPTPALADNKKELARGLFELGIEEYKAKQYHAAALSMEKSYALDPSPNSLYALAQAQRLDNNCKAAVENYNKLLETSEVEGLKKAVKTNLELCAQLERGEKPKVEKEDAAAIERRDAPVLQIRTVYRTKQTNDKLAISMFVGGGVAVSGAVAFFFVGRSARSDADRATSLDDYNEKYDSSILMRNLSIASLSVGVVLLGIGTYRVVRGKKQEESPVALVPLRDGSMVAWSGRF